MPEPDIKLCFKTMPPCIIPVSERAKKLIALPDNVDAVILLNTDPDQAMGAIPGHWIIGDEEEPPALVALIKELEVLH